MNKWIHIIGISGVATSAVAVMFKNLGWKVTGSDKAFFPPASTYLTDNGIEIMAGFKEEHLYDAKGGFPDLVMYQGTKGENNPEIIFAHQKSLQMKTFAELLQEYVIVPNESIVVVGTYGKTTITAALAAMFIKAGFKVSYMFGGIPLSLPYSAVSKTEETQYSIVEGDEYIISLDKPRSKFFLYSPKYLVVNALSWEHLDIFKTKAEYFANFKKLIEQIPADGLIVANANAQAVVDIVSKAKCKVIYYSVDQFGVATEPTWTLVKASKPLPCFMRKKDNIKAFEIIPYERVVVGEFNEENLLAASTLAYELGIKKERIQEAIAEFKGVKRRLEIRFENKNLVVIDDLGSSPPKAQGSIKAIRDDYPAANLLVIYEPNAGNRVRTALPLFDSAFEGIDELLLPRFSRLPALANANRFDEKDLYSHLKNDLPVKLFEQDKDLIEYIAEYYHMHKNEKNVVLFLSSHSLRGMIEDLIQKIS